MSDVSSNRPVSDIAATASPHQPIRAVLMILWLVFNYLFSSIAGSALIYIGYLAIHGQTMASTWSADSVLAQFIYTVVVYALLLVMTVGGFRRWWHLHRRDIGLTRPKLSDPIYALLALPAYYIVYFIVLAIVSALAPDFNTQQQQQLGFNQTQGSGQLLLVFLSLVVIPPLVEEIVVRGYLYSGLKRSLPKFMAVLLASALFAVGHLEFGSGGPLVWVAAVFTFVLALVLTALREMTGRIWAGIFLHALVNGVSFFFLFVVGTR